MATEDIPDDAVFVAEEKRENKDDSTVLIQKYESTETVYETLMNGGHKLSMDTPLIPDGIRTNRGEILSVNLDNRIERLQRWVICYFIFVIAEMIINAIGTEETLDGINKTPYKIWLASDVFLFIGCIVTWFTLHHVQDIANGMDIYEQYLKYIAGGLFILCALLQWIAISQQNHLNYCNVLASIDSDSKTYCQSYVFSLHWMAHIFAIFIGIDIMDIERLNILSNERKVRIIVYCFNVFVMSIIIASDINYFYDKENDILNLDHYAINVVEAGYFIVSFVCLFVAISLILSVFVSAFIIEIKILRKLCAVLILISAGMILFGVNLVIYAQPYNVILSIIPMVMIVYDLQCL